MHCRFGLTSHCTRGWNLWQPCTCFACVLAGGLGCPCSKQSIGGSCCGLHLTAWPHSVPCCGLVKELLWAGSTCCAVLEAVSNLCWAQPLSSRSWGCASARALLKLVGKQCHEGSLHTILQCLLAMPASSGSFPYCCSQLKPFALYKTKQNQNDFHAQTIQLVLWVHALQCGINPPRHRHSFTGVPLNLGGET